MTIQLGRKHNLIGTDHNDPLLEGEDLSHTIGHGDEIEHLIAVLKYLFRNQRVAIVTDVDINLRVALEEEAKFREVYKSPDISVIDGLEAKANKDLATYYIGPNNPPPRLVFEIASDGTWQTDLHKKPYIYAEMGIQEYFTYDPNLVWTGLWRKQGQLLGWRLNSATGKAQEIPLEAKGVWSKGLQSWLRLDANKNLQLYDAKSKLRLTEAEYERAGREQAQTQLKAERQRAEIERQQLEKLKARLREMGQNPDDLLK